MKIKELQRTVNVAWSPAQHHPIMLAAGTAAQQLDATFSTTAALEIYSLNLSEPGLDMELKASVPSKHRFHKVVWGSHGIGSAHPSGVIVGGCEDGHLQIYSASKLLSKEESLIAHQDKHKGAVRALDFNQFQSNLLASGAGESEIYIWDLNNTTTPMTPGAKAQPFEDVQSVSWNKQVQHILASAFSNRCVVWDLRKNEPIIKLSDSQSRIRWKQVAWHPEVATQLCLVSEEDQAPLIQLWDLRFATSPIKVLSRHQRGVLSVAWCQQDPELLISCGKDHNLLCWNPNSEVPGGEVISELPCTTQFNFDVSWCPKNPALIATSSFDGFVSVHSIMGGLQQQVQTSNKIADSFPGMDSYVQAPTPVPNATQSLNDLSKPPKWLRRPVGASFGFGGKLITFENDINNNQQSVQRIVNISQVVTEPELVQRSKILEKALIEGNFAEFCRQKADTTTNQHSRYVWYFLKANFETNPRAEMLNLLGYKPDDMTNKLNKYVTQSTNSNADAAVNNLTNQMAGLSRSDSSDGEGDPSTDTSTDLSGMDGCAAFDAIAAGHKMLSHGEERREQLLSFKIGTGDDKEGLISQALLTGNVEAAVELCFETGRMADAIIIAMTGGSELLARTQYRYLKQSEGYLSVLISALVTEDWGAVVEQCDIESWKEALVAALTHCSRDEMPVLCERLGERLEGEGQPNDAMLCYICAGNMSKVVQASSTQNSTCLKSLMDLVELVMIMQKAAEQQGRSVEYSNKLADLLTRYSLLLAGQGSLDEALAHLGQSAQPDIAELRERLYYALGYKQAYGVQQNQHQLQQQPRGSILSNRKPSQPNVHNAPLIPSNPVGYVPPVNQIQPPQLNQQPGFAPQIKPVYNTGLPNQNYNSSQPAQPWQQTLPPAQVPNVYMQTAPVAHAPVAPPPINQPPRPTSVGSTHGSTIGRSKYVRDPSVQSGPVGGQYGGGYGQNPVPQNQYQQQPINSYNANPIQGMNAPVTSQPFGLNPSLNQNPGAINPMNPVSSSLMNPMIPHNQQPEIAQPALPNLQTRTAPTPPPGWNDPPTLKNARPKAKPDYTAPAPITHPLYGVQEPQVPINQQVYNPNQPQQQFNGYEADPYRQQKQQQVPQQYLYNNGIPPQQFPQQNQMQQQQYGDGLNTQPLPQQPPQSRTPVQEPPRQKGPVPEEHIYLQTVFNELRIQCINAANPQTKRKLEDVGRKLEALYDLLRDERLSANTLQSLHQMVQMVQIGDYAGGLNLHTQLVSGPDFSQIASFMPGLKVLLQSAIQLQVFLR